MARRLGREGFIRIALTGRLESSPLKGPENILRSLLIGGEPGGRLQVGRQKRKGPPVRAASDCFGLPGGAAKEEREAKVQCVCLRKRSATYSNWSGAPGGGRKTARRYDLSFAAHITSIICRGFEKKAAEAGRHQRLKGDDDRAHGLGGNGGKRPRDLRSIKPATRALVPRKWPYLGLP